MIRFLLGFGALALVMLVWSVFDVAMTRTPAAGKKSVWLAVVILVPIVGPVAWIVRGRPRRMSPPRRGRGPDDDPDFLRNL
jgi:hypothetical protein